MFINIIKPLIVNYTILISLVVNANMFIPFSRSSFDNYKKRAAYSLMGTFAALLCMVYPIEVLKDTHFDFRMVIILILTLYCGVFAGVFCTVSVSITRYFIGGDFVVIGVVINLIALICSVLLRRGFVQSNNRVHFSVVVFTMYLLISVVLLETFIPFLNFSFYVIYYLIFFISFVGMIFAIEKMISNNQQLDESVYLENQKTVGHMAAAFAHEIRNPLTTVQGFIQFLKEGDNHNQLYKFSDLILEELERTNRIITEYLSLAKPGDMKHECFIVEEAVRETIKLLNPTAHLHNVSIGYHEEGEHFIHGDRQYLKQALINIIKNSIEAIEQKGKIIICIKKVTSRDKVVISVKDNGIGLTEDEIKQIGLPYYTTKTKGTGLGTMVVNKIIRDMDGTIKYKSIKGKWTKVEIYLPLSTANEQK
ncbi:ATP-binding protein [Priestia abyssalis]|uniref:ATP-binding protein n=1 Tax=Priestia abyssalis TaxID=1221450 RepID=UPI000994EE55|nr:ATP-binding protein [Priestia abyssalis]